MVRWPAPTSGAPSTAAPAVRAWRPSRSRSWSTASRSRGCAGTRTGSTSSPTTTGWATRARRERDDGEQARGREAPRAIGGRVGVNFQQSATVAAYVFKQRLLRREKYPLVL